MSDDSVQNYGNHARWFAPYHFVVAPLLVVNVVLAIIALVREPSLGTLWRTLFALAVAAGIMFCRYMTLRVQDRVIRLEEHLRLARLLPDRHTEIEALTLDQLLGLRFASDQEVPHLVDRISSGDLTGKDEIKRAVQHWRPDHLRA